MNPARRGVAQRGAVSKQGSLLSNFSKLVDRMKLDKKQEAMLYSTVGVVVMLIILVAVNGIASKAKARIDLTADKLYTLSEGTRKVLAKLDTKVKVRLYVTQGENTMPTGLQTHARRVEDLLKEFRQASNGKITIEKLDPQPDSDAEESATLDGVQGQPISLSEKLYLGLAVSCLEQKVAVPFLSPDRDKLLEYDIARAITQVTATSKPVVGIMTSLPMFGQPMNPMMMQMGQRGQSPWVFVNELKNDFEVKQVEMTAETIDDAIKVLLVVHPKQVTDNAQYAIDQFLMRGGKLIAFLDPLSIVDSRSSAGNPMQRAAQGGSTLDKLLKAWGLEFDANKVVADANYVTRINRGMGREEVVPTVLSMDSRGIAQGDVTTSQIDNILLPFAGGFTGTPVSGLTQTVLLKTTTQSQFVEKFMAEMAGEQVMKDFSPSGKEVSLAVRLTGKFKTAFPDGKPGGAAKTDDAKKDEPAPEAASSLKESKVESVVILVGDSDFVFDEFAGQVQEIFGQRLFMARNGNMSLAQNIADQAGGDVNLIQVRSRATVGRPFTVVKEMQAKAEQSYRSKIKQLETELSSAQQRLNELQQKKEGNQRFILSPEQQKEVANFRQRETEVKRELKDVRKHLKRDVDALENQLKWLNIAGMPFLVTASGICLAALKRKKTSAK